MSGVAPDPLDRLSSVAERMAHDIEGRTRKYVYLTVQERDWLVEVARAARDRYASGHNDWCDTQLSPESGYACTCGHAELAAALARLEGSA